MTIAICSVAICQPPPPPPPPPVPNGVPLDGGLVAMLLGLGTYGLKKYFNVDFKKVFSLFILTFLWNYTQAQVPGIEWDNTIGGNYFDDAEVIIETNDKGFLIGGRSMSDMYGDKTENLPLGSSGGDFWVLKLDSMGNILWQNSFGGINDEYLYDAIQTSDGGFLLAGTTNGTSASGDLTEGGHGSIDYLVVKLDALGNVQWQNTIGGNQIDYLEKVVQTSDGGYILGGSSMSGISFEKTVASKGDMDFWIVKIDANGVVVWQKAIGGNTWDYLKSISLCSDGGVLLAGHSSSSISGDKTQNAIGAYDYWLVKIDSLGNVLWDKTYGGSAQEQLYDITQDGLGNFYLAGSSESNISGDKTEPRLGFNDFWIVKINSMGILLWENTVGGNSYELPHSITMASDYRLVVVGMSNSDVSGDKTGAQRGGGDGWVVSLDTSGTVLWDKTIGGSSQDYFASVTFCLDGGIALAARSASSISGEKSENLIGSADYWIVKLEPVFYWTGQINTDWFLASNWLNYSVPDSSNLVVVPDVSSASNNFPIINVEYDMGRLFVNVGASLIVEEGITLWDTLVNNGSLLLKDGAFLDDFSSSIASYQGDITVETIAANGVSLDQRMISSPVNYPNISEIGDDLSGPWGLGLPGINNVPVTVNCATDSLTTNSNYGNLFQYNDAIVTTCPLEGWQVRSSGYLENARGYSAYLANGSTFDFTGTPNTGSVGVMISNSGTGIPDSEGWNLVGNPYPSPISRDAVVAAGGTNATYFVTSGIYQGSYFPYLPGSDIAIAQGFQVYTPNTQALYFDNSFRTTNATTWYSTQAWFDHKLEISVFGNSFADKTILYYHEDATNTYAPLDDVVKISSKPGQPSLSTYNSSKNLALNGLSTNDMAEIVPMSMEPGANGNFSMSFEGLETFPLNTTIYLKDLLLNQLHDIADGDYEFASNTTDNGDRFELMIIPAIQFETAKVDCANNPGAIALNSFVGVENRSFELSQNGVVISSDTLSNLNQNLQGGSYDLVVFDSFNGQQSYTFEIEELESITANFTLSSMEVAVGETFTLENISPNATTVIWEIGGENVSNLDSFIYSFEEEGVYTITLQVSSGDCMDEITQEITVVNKATAIHNQVFNDLLVYPNPSSDLIYLRLSEELSSIKFIDLTGQTVKVFNAATRQLSIADFTPGIYFLEIANAESKSIIKIIKK